jgi:orotidine-5'-phosphate decarboxylase
MKDAAVAGPEAVTGASERQLFGDRVARAVAARASQLVLGLDPDPNRLWPDAYELAAVSSGSVGARERAARAIAAHCALVIDAVGEHCVAVKPQLAWFERLGAPGWAALEEVVERARDHGLAVIADGKRGDIDVTATAYAQAYFGDSETPYGRAPSLGADALTVNPLLGADSLAPFVERARSAGAGLFVLVRTSNPGAADVQELALAQGGSVGDRIALLVAELGAEGIGEAGLSDIGAVVGATAPSWVEALRERMPHAIFLLPGVGAQGGAVESLAPAFAPGPAGGLVSVSRGIVGAYERVGGDPAAAAGAEASRLRRLTWELAS